MVGHAWALACLGGMRGARLPAVLAAAHVGRRVGVRAIRGTVRSGFLLFVVVIGAGCGDSGQASRPRVTPSPILTRRWLSYNAGTKTVTITLVPGADNEFNGYNFNGYWEGGGAR